MTDQSDLWAVRRERARRPFQASSDLRGEPKAGQEPSA
jgi:hypothetical protein